MQRKPQGAQERINRIALIGRVQLAYEQLKETMQRYHDDSPRARAAIAAAKRRLSLLNRALAMLALEVARQPAWWSAGFGEGGHLARCAFERSERGVRHAVLQAPAVQVA